jgi:hypothetical protein
MDMDMQHGHRHAAWTRTCSINIDAVVTSRRGRCSGKKERMLLYGGREDAAVLRRRGYCCDEEESMLL